MRTWIVTLLTAASLVALGGCYYPGHYHGYTSVGISGYYGPYDYYPYPYAYGYPYPWYYRSHGSVIITKPPYRPGSTGFIHRNLRNSYDTHYTRINPWQTDDNRHDWKVRDNRDGRKGKRTFEGRDICFGRHC